MKTHKFIYQITRKNRPDYTLFEINNFAIYAYTGLNSDDVFLKKREDKTITQIGTLSPMERLSFEFGNRIATVVHKSAGKRPVLLSFQDKITGARTEFSAS